MIKNNDVKDNINKLRMFSRGILVFYSFFWLIFALLSGSEQMGGGITGIILNSPNAIPWFFLLGVVYVVWRWEVIGGIVLSVIGLITVMFFDTYESLIVFAIVSLPLILLGISFVACGYISKHNHQQTQKGT